MPSSAEVPLQHSLFGGEPVDSRTKTQKKKAQERQKPQEVMLFTQREVAQFGVKARPLFSLSPKTSLALIAEDPRTEEEKEHDLLLAAQCKTVMMFISESETHEQTNLCSVQNLRVLLLDRFNRNPRNIVAVVLLCALQLEQGYFVATTPEGVRVRRSIRPLRELSVNVLRF